MYYDNKKLALSIFWIVLGLLLCVLSVTEVLDASLYAGVGGALTAVGVLRLIRHVRYRRDSEYRAKIDVEAGDERNRCLRLMSWAWTGYIVVLVEGIGAVVALIRGERLIQMILSFSICLVLVVYCGAYVILSRKY